ncbi:MAG TPA: oligosaccharide flippase family protein [Candidatus Paceibacterota bacterium]
MLRSLVEKVTPLLRWMEKYTKTDMLYLAKGGFWLMLGQGILMASGLILSVAFANLLPKDVYGTYQFIMSMAAVIAAFTLSGMSTAITRSVAAGSEGALRYGFRVQLRWSSAMVVAGGVLAVYYLLNGNNTLALSFLIVGAFSPFLTAFGLTKSYFVGKRLFRESALIGLWRRFIPVFAVLVAILLTDDVVTIVLVYFASNVLSAGLLYTLVIRRYKLPRNRDRDMLAYSKHLSFLSTFSDIASQADKVLIFHFLGAAPVAIYALAQLPIAQVRLMFKLLLSLTMPKFVAAKFEDLQRTLPRKVNIILAATAVAAGMYALAAPYAFMLLFPAYPESVLLSQVLALSLLTIPRSMYGQVFSAHQMKRELYVLHISQNVLRLGLLVTLVPLYGLWGAVYALLATNLYLIALTHYLFLKARSR